MATENFFPGLAQGPLNAEASITFNAIAGEPIPMGAVVKYGTTLITGEIFPRVIQVVATGDATIGVVVAGDADGIYNDTPNVASDENKAALAAGESVTICTQGRCVARIDTTTTTNVGTLLGASDSVDGAFINSVATTRIMGSASQEALPTGASEVSYIVVDLKGQGVQA